MAARAPFVRLDYSMVAVQTVAVLGFVYADVRNGLSIGGALNKHPEPWTDRAQGYIVDVFVQRTDGDGPMQPVDASGIVADAIVLAAAAATRVAGNGSGN